MVRKLSRENFYQIRDPKNFYAEMRSDVELLLSKRAYTSLTTLIMCCLDALGAPVSGEATRGTFEKFVEQHFHDLCNALGTICGRKGSGILYEKYRNGLAHLRGPKSEFAIAEHGELGGAWADIVDVDEIGQFKTINVDRLAKEFLALLTKLEA